MSEDIKERVLIRNLYAKKGKDAPKRINFEQSAKTDKGIALYYDELMAGQPIFQQDPEGMLVPAPEGEHVMEDGTKVVIELGADGISMIKEVMPAAAPETPAANPEAQAQNPVGNGAPNDAAAKARIRSVIEEVRFKVAEDLDLENTCQALTECIKVLQAELTEKETKFSAEKKEVEDENKSLREQLVELAKPAAEPTHVAKTSKFLKGIEPGKNDGMEVWQRIRNLNK